MKLRIFTLIVSPLEHCRFSVHYNEFPAYRAKQTITTDLRLLICLTVGRAVTYNVVDEKSVKLINKTMKKSKRKKKDFLKNVKTKTLLNKRL